MALSHISHVIFPYPQVIPLYIQYHSPISLICSYHIYHVILQDISYNLHINCHVIILYFHCYCLISPMSSLPIYISPSHILYATLAYIQYHFPLYHMWLSHIFSIILWYHSSSSHFFYVIFSYLSMLSHHISHIILSYLLCLLLYLHDIILYFSNHHLPYPMSHYHISNSIFPYLLYLPPISPMPFSPISHVIIP